MQGPFLRKYGEETTIPFELFEVDGVDFRTDAVHASGDTFLTKDEGAEANTTNSFTDEGSGYSLTLTATEMQAARVVVYLVDQTATKVWLDDSIVVETYGHASAQHAFDLDTASTAQTGDSYARLGAPAGASVSADIATVDTEVGGIQTDLDNGTDGLGAIKTAVDAIPTSNPTAGAIADAVWDEPKADHTTVTSFGDLATDLDSVLADTNELQSDDVPGLIGALNDLSAAQVNAEVDTALSDYDGPTKTEMDTAFTEIKGATFVEANDALDAQRAALDATDTVVDSNNTLLAGLNDFDPATEDVNVGSISGSTTAADNLEASALGVVSSTCAAGSSTTSIVTNLTETTDDQYIGRVIVFTSGGAAGEATEITDYNGTTKTLTVTALVNAPTSGNSFVIV